MDAGVLLLIALLTSVPRLVLVLAIAAVQSSSVFSLLAILSLTYWTVSAQLVRAEMLRIRQLPFVEAAQALGIPHWQIIIRHTWPVLCKTIAAYLPLSVATLIGFETTLSFLGVGLPPEVASWGRLLATARQDPTAWWLIAFPATTILLTILALRRLIVSSADKAH
ncbi:ABC transporter permease [Hymenobacter cellulosilyticus]|uniref:ABC transporter permease subunit n=1 Tax=Hymenobacter cellulosilyticus TaxID=2932248 RepID=A0A8T9Q5G2_9BACT|nr:ABC transporter permease subunit [Hymenobacter cellulosilyticus]UOQ72335.1 ABC transporter permease subunit [Hymenobacter cellulosilyticus]